MDGETRIGGERMILLLIEGAFWVILAVILWPVTLAYLGYRLVKRQTQRGLAAVLEAKAAKAHRDA